MSRGGVGVRVVSLALAAICAFAFAPSASSAQSGRAAATRRATTVGALVRYPVYFHGQPVRVRGTVRPDGEALVLAAGEASVLLAGPQARQLVPDADSAVEVTGRFFDVGRLSQTDPQAATLDLEALVRARLGKPWPGVNELQVLVPETAAAAESFAAPSIRALALAPERYLEARVTVTGRFRARNLYGDQPDAPGRSRWDFVLQSAEASVWVVGFRPRGQGFNLNVESRIDTDKWLEVNGVVRRERQLVLLEATSVRLVQPPAEPRSSEPAVRVPTFGPPPEVVFSTPTSEETDVSRTAAVRVQFSRDLDPASLKGQVRVSYLGAQATERGEPQAPPVAVSMRYDEGSRVLELRFPDGLERFRTVKVELLEGIRSTDGAALAPWTLTFSVGG